MAHRGIRREMVNQGILAGKTLVDKPPEAALAIPAIVSVEIVPTHLIHHNAYHQFWPG
jgi:hypothetical protein